MRKHHNRSYRRVFLLLTVLLLGGMMAGIVPNIRQGTPIETTHAASFVPGSLASLVACVQSPSVNDLVTPILHDDTNALPNHGRAPENTKPSRNPSLRFFSPSGAMNGRDGLPTGEQTGGVYGVAYDKVHDRLFFGAYAKRTTGYGDGASNTVRIWDNPKGTNAPNPFPSFAVGSATPRQANWNVGGPLAAPNNWDYEIANMVGKVGLGDLRISPDGKSLLVMNLEDKTVYVYDIESPGIPGAPAVSYDVPSILTSARVPDAGNYAPFALAFYPDPFRTILAIGATYEGGIDPPIGFRFPTTYPVRRARPAPLTEQTTKIVVVFQEFERDPAAPMDTPLARKKGDALLANETDFGTAAFWNPYPGGIAKGQKLTNTAVHRQARFKSNVGTNAVADGFTFAPYLAWGMTEDVDNRIIIAPSPMLTSISFAPGDTRTTMQMFLGIRDRTGDQHFSNNPPPGGGRAAIAQGDLLVYENTTPTILTAWALKEVPNDAILATVPVARAVPVTDQNGYYSRPSFSLAEPELGSLQQDALYRESVYRLVDQPTDYFDDHSHIGGGNQGFWEDSFITSGFFFNLGIGQPQGHAESAMGGLYAGISFDGTDLQSYLASTMITAQAFNTQGMAQYSVFPYKREPIARGTLQNVVAGSTALAGKGSGLGAIETLCPWAILGGEVWEDMNKNGVKDDGEPVPSVISSYVVEIANAATPDTVLQSLTPDSAGKFAFVVAPHTEYRIRFQIPSYSYPTLPNTTSGGTECRHFDPTCEYNDSDVFNSIDPNQYYTVPLAVGRSQTNLGIASLGVVPKLSGWVEINTWLDLDNDSQWGTGESLFTSGSVTYRLTNVGTGTSYEQTSSTGRARFEDVELGKYTASIVPPAGSQGVPTINLATATETTDSDGTWTAKQQGSTTTNATICVKKQSWGFPLPSGCSPEFTSDNVEGLTFGIRGGYDLRVRVVADPTSVVRGNDGLFTITVDNLTGATATDVELELFLPDWELPYTALVPGGTVNANRVTYTGLTFAAGSSRVFHVRVPTSGTAPPTNSAGLNARVAPATNPPDSNPANNTDSAQFTIVDPDVRATITCPDEAGPGDTVTCQLGADFRPNTGRVIDYSEVIIWGYLQDGIAPTVQGSFANPTTTSSVTYRASPSTAQPMWRLTTPNTAIPVAHNGRPSRTMEFVVPDDRTTDIEICTYVQSTPRDADEQATGTDNRICTVVQIVSPDLEIAKTGPATSGLGVEVSYTISYQNIGSGRANQVVIEDLLGPHLTYVRVNGIGNPTVTTVAGGTLLRWDLGSVSPQPNPVVFTVVAVIAADTPQNVTEVVNTATVEVPVDPRDPNPLNNTSTVQTRLLRPAIEITKSGPPRVAFGTPFQYTIDVVNNGGIAANDVIVTDSLPNLLRLSSFSMPTPILSSRDGNVRDFNLGTIGVGQTKQIELRVVAENENIATFITNRAVVRHSTPGDPSTTPNPCTVVGNRHCSTVTTEILRPDLSLGLTCPATVFEQTIFRMNLSYENLSPDVAVVDPRLDLPLPAGFSLVPPSSVADLDLTGTTVAPGGSGTIPIYLRAPAVTVVTPFDFTATYRNPQPGDPPFNNTATCQVSVVPLPEPVAANPDMRIAMRSTFDPDAGVYVSTGTSVTWPAGEVLDWTPLIVAQPLPTSPPSGARFEFEVTQWGWKASPDGRVNPLATDSLARSGCRSPSVPATSSDSVSGCVYAYAIPQVAPFTPRTTFVAPAWNAMNAQAHTYWSFSSLSPPQMRSDVFVSLGGTLNDNPRSISASVAWESRMIYTYTNPIDGTDETITKTASGVLSGDFQVSLVVITRRGAPR